MEFLAVCRICLQKNVHHVVKNLQLQEVYEQLTAIPFQSDRRPLGLCYICYAQLRASHWFKIKCLQAEQLLEQMLADDGEVLDPTLTDQSIINHLSFSAVEQTIIPDSDLQDVERESVKIMSGNDVGLDEDSTEEAAYGMVLRPDKTQSPSDQGYNVPLINLEQDKASVRTRQGYRLKKAAPIAKMLQLKPDPDTVEADCKTSLQDMTNPVFSDISNINRKYETIEHDIYQQNNLKDDSKVDLRKRNTKNNDLPAKKSYTCDLCDKCFDKKYNLKTHICKHHMDKKPFVCDLCPKSFSSKSHLDTHAREHTATEPYVCDVCEKVFPKKSLLRTHKRKHKVRVKKYICDVCTKGFFYKSQFEIHLKSHIGEKRYVCNTCGDGFAKKSALRTHLFGHRGPGVFICNMCKRGFTSQLDLNRHASVHAGEKAFICHVCGNNFSSKSYLMRHVLIHSGDRPRPCVCKVCNKSFTTNNSLKIHTRIHTGVRPFVCNVCGKAFMQSQTLLKHSWIHTGDRPYICNVCGKGFRAANHLNVHSRSHSGERPYSCDQCGKGFTTRGNLTVHLRLHAAEKVRNKNGDN